MCGICLHISTGMYVHTKNAHTETLKYNELHPVIKVPLAVDHTGVFHFFSKQTVPELEPNENMREQCARLANTHHLTVKQQGCQATKQF